MFLKRCDYKRCFNFRLRFKCLYLKVFIFSLLWSFQKFLCNLLKQFICWSFQRELKLTFHRRLQRLILFILNVLFSPRKGRVRETNKVRQVQSLFIYIHAGFGSCQLTQNRYYTYRQKDRRQQVNMVVHCVHAGEKGDR